MTKSELVRSAAGISGPAAGIGELVVHAAVITSWPASIVLASPHAMACPRVLARSHYAL